MWYLHEVLIVARTYIDVLLPAGITAYNDIAYSVLYAVADNAPSGHTHCVINTCITFSEIEILSEREAFVFLLVLDTLKPCIFLVEQTIV